VTGLAASSDILVCAVWLLIVATAAIVFRRRIANALLRVARPQEDPSAQRRDLTMGVVLMAVFTYVVAATVTAMWLLPSSDQPWPLAVGLPVAAVVSILYWIRFANAGLSVTSWFRSRR
jgi:hypothetical protein